MPILDLGREGGMFARLENLGDLGVMGRLSRRGDGRLDKGLHTAWRAVPLVGQALLMPMLSEVMRVYWLRRQTARVWRA